MYLKELFYVQYQYLMSQTQYIKKLYFLSDAQDLKCGSMVKHIDFWLINLSNSRRTNIQKQYKQDGLYFLAQTAMCGIRGTASGAGHSCYGAQ